MDNLHVAPMSDDLSALAWVQEELRKSLDAAHKALHRCLKEVGPSGLSDIDAIDPGVLRQARQQIHQSVGALELAGLTAGATMLRASEAVIQKFISRPAALTTKAVETVEHASFALLDYMARKLSGKSVSALALFPQYEALMSLAGGGMARPIDLWSQDWPTVSLEAPLAVPAYVQPRAVDAAAVEFFEAGLLQIMRRSQASDAAPLAQLCAGLAADASQRHAHRESATWMLASGFLEALAAGHVPLGVHAKRVLSALLSQLRVLAKGQDLPSDRLAQELLFFCAQASGVDDAQDSVLSRVRKTFGLTRHTPVDLLDSKLGRYDPAWITQAVKRVAGAKDGWSAVAGGELLRLGGLNEQFALVSDSLRRLYPDGDVLAESLSRAVAQTVQSGQSPEPSLAMEVATSILYLEASLEDAEFDHPDQQGRVDRLAARIDAVRQGQPPASLEAWMEDLYRRVSDRQTIGSVVQELRTNLSEAEKSIDQFFRDTSDRSVLSSVPSQLQAMRGVLAVLGLDLAGQATVRMRDDVNEFLQPDTDVQDAAHKGLFDRLATNLSALGFLIDMLGVQPNLVKSLFRYDSDTGILTPLIGRERQAQVPDLADPVEVHAQHAEREQAQAAVEALADSVSREDVHLDDVSGELQKLADIPLIQDQPVLAESLASAQAAVASAQASDDEAVAQAAREQVAQVMSDFAQSVSDAVTLEPVAAEPAAPVVVAAPLMPSAQAPVESTGLEEDDEMRGIFLEEATEVVETARDALSQLESQPGDIGLLTTVRRSFHTLKGSSRMVGLNDYGEAAWACEQLFNAWLASQNPASPDLLALTADALNYMAGWTDAISTRQDQGWASAPVIRAADALRLEGRLQAIDAQPAAEVTEVIEAMPVIVDEVVAPAAEPVEMTEALAPVDVEETPVDLEVLPEVSTADSEEVVLTAPVEAIELSELIESPEGEFPSTSIEPVTQPGDLAEAALPSLEGELLSLDLGEEVPGADASAPDLLLDVPAAEAEVVELSADELPLEVDAVELDLGAIESLPVDATHVADEAGTVPDALDVAPVELTLSTSDLALPEEGEALASADESPAAPEESDEQVKVVGPLRISIPLFNIYLNEADEQSRRLCTNLSEWALELQHPVSDDAVALAHSLAGNSATVGYSELSQLARLLEHSLMRAQTLGEGEADAAALFNEAADEIRHLLHQFAAGFLKTPNDEIMRRLEDYDHEASRRIEARSLVADDTSEDEVRDYGHLKLVHSAEPIEEAPVPLAPVQVGVAEITSVESLPVAPVGQAARTVEARSSFDDTDDIDAEDIVDPDLFPIFEEEARELLPQLAGQMREWLGQPGHPAAPAACMRTLHTFKGGARLAGAMRLGELAHRMETAIEHLTAKDVLTHADVEPIEARVDALVDAFEHLCQRDAQAYEAEASKPLPPAEPIEHASAFVEALTSADLPTLDSDVEAPAVVADAETQPVTDVDSGSLQPDAPSEAQVADLSTGTSPELASIDWARVANHGHQRAAAQQRDASPQSTGVVRVRPQLLDRLVNHAGEVSITRTRLGSQIGQIRGSLTDLTDNLDRLRQQLRDIEIQADTQMNTRMEAARQANQNFDPLEFDRYTRFQELTRMMAESVNDVATVQRSLTRSLETAEDQLAAQARLTRDLQDDLLRTRMVEFEGLSDRLYRVVRQAAKETGKQVRLDIVGGATEVDRGVLDRMTGSFEHLLRNCITHGIELPDVRQAAGKEAAGLVTVSLQQEGNEVSIEFRDDGAGLNLDRIRDKAVSLGLIAPDAQPTHAELAQLIFMPGFSTAETVTGLAGRGVGMDVVRSDVNAMGGRIETATATGQGTSFRLILPLTTAVTQVVMLRAGAVTVAVPTHLIEMVRRAKQAEVDQAYAGGSYQFGEHVLPFYWLGALLQLSPRGLEEGRTLPVIIIRSAQQRIAVHVDEVLGNQEVVVKNLGPQLSRLPGLAGMTLMASGAISLIYNPVALAAVYGERAQAFTAQSLQGAVDIAVAEEVGVPEHTAAVAEAQPPLVLVVDDSLTVRRVTQRLLAREGYRVTLAKDGIDALERLAEEIPAVVLSDIEMPRMDGFDLLRNIRANGQWANLPVVMITSRIAQKHRDHAEQLGVNHYLGKPYGEEELLALVARYALQHEAAAVPGSE